MIPVLPTVVVVTALLAAAWAVALTILDRPGGRWFVGLLALTALVEVLLLAQSVTGFVLLAGTSRTVDALAFGGYLAGSLLVLPAGAAWAFAERSRWGPGALAVACLTIPVLVVRMHQLWNGAGA